MPRVVIHKTTGEVGEMQSDATAGTLLKNISDNGGNADDFEERVMTISEYENLLALDPTRMLEREIKTEVDLISQKTKQVADDRDRKEAMRLLKLGGKTFNHFDDNGKRK